ncbi:MAG: sulfurtransferase [Magnetococcales bacterium]|nr:sulfurtransferase [Magnetococcales bacterium]
MSGNHVSMPGKLFRVWLTRSVSLLLMVIFMTFSTAATAAPDGNGFPGKFVETSWLVNHLNDPDLRIVQVGGDNFYANLHIPGALLVLYQEIVTTRDGVPAMRADAADLVALFGRLGIGPTTRVLAYDAAGGLDAARFIWTLATLGHEQGAVLDGGMVAWYQESKPVTPVVPSVPSVAFKPAPTETWSSTWNEVQKISQSQDPTILLDTRSEGEYLGRNLNGPRGHIPRARHLDWTESLRDRQMPVLKDRQLLMDLLAARGLRTPDQPVIVYCQTAHRASQTWLLLRHLGFSQVRLYDGSMAEWGLRNLPLVVGANPQ